MMGISLFGTCTMKYNPRIGEAFAARPELAELHPYQDESTLQGVLEVVYGLDEILRGLSGMSQFVFQAGGGAHAAYTFAAIARAFHAERGELGRRDEVITTIQAHPCNSATAAAAGFKVVTLMLEEEGYPSVDALRAAVSDRTAALMVNNPDDMGIYNPHIDEWVRIVHDAGGLCFYDHANFNGVMGKIRARDLGFDACMYMLHKTFGAPKGGGGPRSARSGAARSWRASCPRRSSRATATASGSITIGRRASARCASSGATSRSSSRPTPGRARWAPTGSTRPRTCRCSRTTTWRRACSRFPASRARTPRSTRTGWR